MVITLKEIKWTQTLEEVHLRVVFTGNTNLKKWNIFTSSNFIKLHCPPFFREIFLAHLINESESTCRILQDEVRFILKKCVAENWEHFEKSLEAGERIKMKEDILVAAHAKHEQEVQDKVTQTARVKREDMEREIKRESTMREQTEEIHREIIQNEKSKIEKIQTPQKEFPEKARKIPIVPGVRCEGTIKVTFTDRRFPTPKRASQDDAEQQWMTKQHEARKVIGFVEENLRPEERNPQWLKDKGSDFFRKNNFLGAISAYSTAIRLTPQCYDLYLERSACHLAVGNFQRCIEDCSKAYELLVPRVEANAAARIQCLARRGAALCKLGFLREGLDELQAAQKLTPDDKDLQQDIEMIQERLNQFDEDDE